MPSTSSRCVPEPFEQVAGGRLFEPAALPRSPLLVGRRIGRQSGFEERLVALEEVGEHHRREVKAPVSPGVVGGRLHRAQQRFEVGGPGLVIFLLKEGELAPSAKRRWWTLHRAWRHAVYTP
jgi:hypothetical protein